jgi:SAM-dependent methyltransferase
MVGCRGGGVSAERVIVARTVEDLPVEAPTVGIETVDCCFCGSSEYSPYDSVDEWRIVKCNHCGFCFTNPRPTVESLPSFYDLRYFKDDDVARLGFFNEDGSPNLGQDIGYHHRIADLESRVDKRGSLLELGAALGGFLSVMRKRGWKVSGVEVSREAVEIARKNEGINIFCGKLEEFETTETYDVVCMYHSLEHTPNPAFVIEKTYELLNPGGIVVIEVPNLEGFDARINRERKLLSYDLPRHLSHFTPALLSKKLEKKGFEILEVDLYYPNFILRLAEAGNARRRGGNVDQPVLDSDDGHAAQHNVDLPMARRRINWKTRLLKYASQVFPGWRFTIVARK